MSKVIICGNQKGGVAKTTTVVNLGIGLARKGKKVLVIDNDPQGSLTEALGYQEPDRLEITLAQVMDWVLNEEKFDLNAGILHHAEGVDLMPANIELSTLKVICQASAGNETAIREILKFYDAYICKLYDIIGGSNLLSSIVVFLLAPLENKNKKLNVFKKRIYRFVSTVIYSIGGILGIVLKSSYYMNILSIVLMITTALLIIGKGGDIYEKKVSE